MFSLLWGRVDTAQKENVKFVSPHRSSSQGTIVLIPKPKISAKKITDQ